MVIDKIKYAEVNMTEDDFVYWVVDTCIKGKNVGITTSANNSHFLLEKMFSHYDIVGTDDHINIGRGKLYVFDDSVELIKSKKIEILFCDKYSILGRSSIPVLSGVKMIRCV